MKPLYLQMTILFKKVYRIGGVREEDSMNPFEMMSFAKFVMSAFTGNVTPSEAEIEAGTMMLKNIADNSPRWNQQQKDVYKLLVDVVKDNNKK